jgi:hypothetical protein
MALNHMPSGRFAANAAWLAFNVIAHNLARWITRLGLGGDPAHHQDRPHPLHRPARQAGPKGAASASAPKISSPLSDPLADRVPRMAGGAAREVVEGKLVARCG